MSSPLVNTHDSNDIDDDGVGVGALHERSVLAPEFRAAAVLPALCTSALPEPLTEARHTQ